MSYDDLIPNFELELKKVIIKNTRIDKINSIINIYKSKQSKE